MLLSRHVLLWLMKHLDVSDIGVEQRHTNLASELVDFVSEQNVRAQVVLASLDTNNLSSHIGTIKIRHLDNITRTQPRFCVHESTSFTCRVMFLKKLLVQEKDSALAVSLFWKRLKHLSRTETP